MTKKTGETLKKTAIEKKKTSLRISKKHPSKTTKKVILEAPILDQVSNKHAHKRTISRKKPILNAVGSSNDIQNTKPVQEENIIKPEMIEASQEILEKDVKKEIAKIQETHKIQKENNIIIEEPKIENVNKDKLDHIQEILKGDIDKKETEVIKEKNSAKSKTSKTTKAPKKSNTSLKPVTPKSNVEKNGHVLNTKQILVKPKKTLHLKLNNKNLNDEQTSARQEETKSKSTSMVGFENIPIVEATSMPQKKEITINQNSSFFYEPTIFQKFDIEISNVNEEQTSTNDTNNLVVDEINENILAVSDIPVVDDAVVEDSNSDDTASIDENSIDSSNVDEITIVDDNTSDIFEEYEENIEDEEDVEESILPEDLKINDEDSSVLEKEEIDETSNGINISPALEETTDENTVSSKIDETSSEIDISDDDLINALLEDSISFDIYDEAKKEQIDNESKEEQLIENSENQDEKLDEKNIIQNEESFDFTSNDIPDELKENIELSEEKQKFIEDASDEYDFISLETPDIYNLAGFEEITDSDLEQLFNNNSTTDSATDTTTIEDSLGDNTADSSEAIENNNDNEIEIIENETNNATDDSINDTTVITEADVTAIQNNIIEIKPNEDESITESSKDSIKILENDDLKMEAADNFISDTVLKNTNKLADNAVGKFFDSSSENISNSTDNSYFKKIKKSIFSNIPAVFKKFSYEEASLIQSNNKFLEEASENSNSIELSNSSNIIDTKNVENVVGNLENNNSNIITTENLNNNLANNIVSNAENLGSNAIPPISQNLDNENNLGIDNVSASANTLVIPTINENILESEKNNFINNSQDSFSNIIDSQSSKDLSIADINIDDIDIDDIDIADIEALLDEPEVSNEQSEKISSKQDDNNGILAEDSLLNVTETTENIESFEENNEEFEEDSFDDLDNLSDEEVDKELDEALGITPEENEENDDDFSIEEYFGITTSKEDENNDIDDFDNYDEENDEDEQVDQYHDQMQSFSKLIENFSQTISTLSDKITKLETGISSNQQFVNEIIEQQNTKIENKDKKDDSVELSKNEEFKNDTSELQENNTENQNNFAELQEQEDKEIQSDINIDDISIDDISLDDISLEDLENFEDSSPEESLLPVQEDETKKVDDKNNNEDNNTNNNENGDIKSVEDILLEAFDNPDIDEQMKQELLSEVLSVEDDVSEENTKFTSSHVETETTSDFFKIIDSLSKTISELEKAPDIVENIAIKNTDESTKKENIVETPLVVDSTTENTVLIPASDVTNGADEVAPIPENTSDKAINILINKDDIFSIAILNETYEIVTDFDGISVLSENIHISTPKNNFYVNIGEKYIEIHKKPDLFVVNTNFEDIEFANAINNVTFAKKKNKIELNIKEAFKISSVNKKIELSMLNTSIANISGTAEKSDSDSSICDNKTLLINEETQKVYLPYTIEEVMKKLNSSSEYQSLDDVIEQEYTLPLSTFKMPIISRFKEAYRFMRVKEGSSVYAALDLAVELMFNSNLNPAVIRASKDLKELNIYLDCLYENELEKFDCFKVVYKVLPKIQ